MTNPSPHAELAEDIAVFFRACDQQGGPMSAVAQSIIRRLARERAELVVDRDAWKLEVERAGVCMSCVRGGTMGMPCHDCMGTGYNQGAPLGFVREELLTAAIAERDTARGLALKHGINSIAIDRGEQGIDFGYRCILAEYLTDCLAAYDRAVTAREDWYGAKDVGGVTG